MEASAPADELSCPRCGAEVAPGQQYCLECGARLPVSAAAETRPVRTGAAWVWPVLVTLVVAVVAAATVVAAQATRDESEEPFLVATTEQPALPPLTAEEPAPATTAVPTETSPAETEPAPPPETAPPAEPPADQLLTWPEGTDGWTVVLASIPEGAGRAAAVRRAREAADAGLPEVGVLRSDRYPSLRPGYWVVFSGIRGSRAQAEQTVPAARAAGYDTAYPSPIAR